MLAGGQLPIGGLVGTQLAGLELDRGPFPRLLGTRLIKASTVCHVQCGLGSRGTWRPVSSREGHGDLCGFRRMKRVLRPRSQPLFPETANSTPENKTPLPRPPSAVTAGGQQCPLPRGEQLGHTPCTPLQVEAGRTPAWGGQPSSEGTQRKGRGQCPKSWPHGLSQLVVQWPALGG